MYTGLVAESAENLNSSLIEDLACVLKACVEKAAYIAVFSDNRYLKAQQVCYYHFSADTFRTHIGPTVVSLFRQKFVSQSPKEKKVCTNEGMLTRGSTTYSRGLTVLKCDRFLLSKHQVRQRAKLLPKFSPGYSYSAVKDGNGVMDEY